MKPKIRDSALVLMGALLGAQITCFFTGHTAAVDDLFVVMLGVYAVYRSRRAVGN